MTAELSWVEKYRPKSLDDVKGQHETIKNLKEKVATKNITHLIFEGMHGTGKTSTALALTNDLYSGLSKHTISENLKELNASDARGIGVVRTVMKDFCKTTKSPQVPFKILILDEADNMTNPAFQALRRTMEKYSKNCRIIMLCNYANKIIPPIQSRCTVIHFDPLSINDIEERLEFIIERENVIISDKAVETLSRKSNGDLRWAINMLQAVVMIYGSGNYKISTRDVYSLSGSVDETEIRDLIKLAIDGEITQALAKIKNFLNSGISGKELTMQIFYETKFGDYDEMDKVLIASLSSDTIYRLGLGGSELIQLRGLIAGIKSGRLTL